MNESSFSCPRARDSDVEKTHLLSRWDSGVGQSGTERAKTLKMNKKVWDKAGQNKGGILTLSCLSRPTLFLGLGQWDTTHFGEALL